MRNGALPMRARRERRRDAARFYCGFGRLMGYRISIVLNRIKSYHGAGGALIFAA